MKENNYNLFYDYSNISNIKENIKKPKKYSLLSTYYYYPTTCNTNIKNINIELNSISFNERIKKRKEAFNKICNSINQILSKYKNNKIKIEKASNKDNNYLNNENQNVNRIAEHLINTFSKEELKLIKEKINTKIEEEEEPKPEIFLSNNYIKRTHTKLNKNLNENNILKKINKNKTLNKSIRLETDEISNYKKINNKNIKNKRNNEKIIRRNINNDYQLNPTFLTYIKCKTSLECLDNYLKRQRKKRNNTEIRKVNIKSKTPNISTNTSSKYLIKTRKIQKEKREKNQKKYINHKYDYIKSLYKNDKFLLERIKEQNNKKLKKYEKIKKEQNKEKLEQCTFKPDISKTSHKNILRNKNFNLNKNRFKQNETEKNLSYLDFYQYKQNREKRLCSKKGKNERSKKLSSKQIPKELKRTKSDKKKRNINNKNFLEFHKLIIQKSLKE